MGVLRASRRRTGTIRLPSATARSSSYAQCSDASESGLITNVRVGALSIARSISSRQPAVGEISSESSQTSLPLPMSSRRSRVTNASSARA